MSFWLRFWILLISLWDPFSIVLVSFWSCFGAVLGSFCIRFGSFWCRFGSVLGTILVDLGWILDDFLWTLASCFYAFTDIFAIRFADRQRRLTRSELTANIKNTYIEEIPRIAKNWQKPKANERRPPNYTLQHAVHETRSTEANASNNTGSAVLAPHGALGLHTEKLDMENRHSLWKTKRLSQAKVS